MEAAARKVVLRPEVGEDAIDDLARAAGWQLTNVVPEGPRRPAQTIFATNGGLSAVYFVRDGRLGVTYAAATGPEAEALLDHVAEALPAVPATIALEGAPEAVQLGLAVVALAGAPPDEATLARLAALARADDPRLRGAVLTAITYAPFAAFAPLVDGFRADPDPALRQAAAQIQAAFPTLSEPR